MDATNPRNHPRQCAQDGCPFVNQNDVRCATRFSLGRLDQMFSVCFGGYHACPMYHRINAEAAAELCVITVSAPEDAPRHVIRLPLLPTGT